ncbi:LysR family transcriptional regulator [Cognatilysobacter bugurensis]|uniref:LysR family transcriptional regulator n=1 Tax=Cognatilysobacter bugurensis TaxID=543356 RepID=A0A918SXP5_9GAMM|nr:LysR family transcriptional regulator [Lysobacter bugurensis]GHA76862.1 LysR family transcriptional regulator [Lysobacter bugurensis]
MSRHFGDVGLGSIELFCLAAEHESFTTAAVHAGLTPAAVSRTIARMEERLKVRLFVRSTRRIRMTDSGRAYYAQCRQALDQLVDAERELTGAQVEPAGTLRISIPTPLGHHRILPLLPRFRERFHRVGLEIHLSNRNVDLVAEGLDLAVRARVQPDSGLIARKLLDAELVVVGTPTYLEAHGRPATPQDLSRHQCIQFVLPSSGQHVPWMFRDSGRDFELVTPGALTCSEDLLGISTLALHGGGLAQTYRFIVERELADGRLIEVLKEYGGRSRPFSLVYPATRHMPLHLRAFIDFLIEEITSSGPPRL